jgi:ribosomal protein S18 acetylase RimI-like enzyme
MSTTFTIREKRSEDEPRAAQLLVDCFREKYLAIAGGSEKKALQILGEEMRRRGKEGNFFVAESAGAVVGAVEIVGTDIIGIPWEEEMSICLKRLGLGPGLRAIYLLSLLGRAIHEDEACVSQLAVSSSTRGCGVAKALLARGEEFARSRRKKEIVLWVSGSNAPALGLYGSSGFNPSRTTASKLHEKFFGVESWVEMRKDISGLPV